MREMTVQFIDRNGNSHLVKMMAPDHDAAIDGAAGILLDNLFSRRGAHHEAAANAWLDSIDSLKVWHGAFDNAPSDAPIYQETSPWRERPEAEAA